MGATAAGVTAEMVANTPPPLCFISQQYCRHASDCLLGWYRLLQTCQGPEMKMRETIRHLGEGAIFSAGRGREPCL